MIVKHLTPMKMGTLRKMAKALCGLIAKGGVCHG